MNKKIFTGACGLALAASIGIANAGDPQVPAVVGALAPGGYQTLRADEMAAVIGTQAQSSLAASTAVGKAVGKEASTAATANAGAGKVAAGVTVGSGVKGTKLAISASIANAIAVQIKNLGNAQAAGVSATVGSK